MQASMAVTENFGEACPASAPFFGYMGAAAALIFASACPARPARPAVPRPWRHRGSPHQQGKIPLPARASAADVPPKGPGGTALRACSSPGAVELGALSVLHATVPPQRWRRRRVVFAAAAAGGMDAAAAPGRCGGDGLQLWLGAVLSLAAARAGLHQSARVRHVVAVRRRAAHGFGHVCAVG